MINNFMIKKTVIPKLIEKYRVLLQAEKVDVPENELLVLANSIFDKAVISFNNLKSPKVCENESAYLLFWLEEEFNIFFQKKALKKAGSEIKDYFAILPLKLFAEKERQLFGIKPFEERKKTYRKYQPMIKALHKPFENLIKSRNIITNGIPDEDFNRFLKNSDRVIDYLYSNLPKVKNLPEWFFDQLNKPCLLCLIPFKDLKVPEDVIDFVTKKYPELKLISSKIHFIYTDRSYTRYVKESDTFEVSINKNVNIRHQMVILVHELGHVISFLQSFKRSENILGLGKYTAEKRAIKIELEILNLIDPKILKAYYLDLLLVLHRSLFELAIYEKPKQNYDFLYAKLFNKCFPETNQKTNPFYLLDETIIARPFSSLPYAVASVNILFEKTI